MSKRIEQSRRRGPWDPRYEPEAAAAREGRVSIVTPRNSPRRGLGRSTAERTNASFRHELCDTQGKYIGTFVTQIERWQIGDAFTAGDGRALRITGIAMPQRSNQRPAYTDRWNVEPIETAADANATTETDER